MQISVVGLDIAKQVSKCMPLMRMVMLSRR
jgi:hypothetical protein